MSDSSFFIVALSAPLEPVGTGSAAGFQGARSAHITSLDLWGVARAYCSSTPAIYQRNYFSTVVDIFAPPNLFEMSPTALLTCERWDSFCHRLYHAYQDVAMDLVESHG